MTVRRTIKYDQVGADAAGAAAQAEANAKAASDPAGTAAGLVGTLGDLTTTEKDSTVGAINEVHGEVVTARGASASLDARLDGLDTQLAHMEDGIADAHSHIADTNNPHAVSVGQIGAEPSGSVSTHNSAIDAHSDIRSELLSLSDDIPSDPLPREADTLEGHNASYYTTYSDTAVSNHNISGTAHSDIRSQLAHMVQNFKIKNQVVNGDFSNGTTGWDSVNGVLSISNTNLLVTSSGNSKYVTIRNEKSISSNNKYFLYGKLKTSNSNLLSYRLWCGDNTFIKGITPILNSFTEVYGIATPSADNAYNFYLEGDFGTPTNANGATYEVDSKAGVFAINMTELGIEDFTANEMYKIVKMTGYFEGEHGLTQEESFKITLSLMRENRNAIIALGGTIV